ncbi:ATP-binding cassette sub-family C member 4 isoform X1 [Neodiprion lecontei]|uniref:ATP-binding cassette sub-family C member 4 isoform X1 n=3 Tax=Neodiprion lecontei TaxID=441921 RepID=A0A6J0C746_NEOLC|nr:ATP-binding cassette sub-family C member 4 isoform X1 [Neodiprion lecontei]XP_046597110.1 ATP-binding cassette sub-family C member 4 isoform X1 [Neodiprion lecontei]
MDAKKKQVLRNPKETANILNWLFFGWILPIFREGYKRDLQIEDLYDPLKSNESESLGDRLEREWKKELAKRPKSQPSLLRALIRIFWLPSMIQGVVLLIQLMVLEIMLRVCQGWVISYFDTNQNSTTPNQALFNIGILIFVSLSIVFIDHHNDLRAQEIGMCVRIACCSMIYRKVLRLDLSTTRNGATGKVANLISNDVARFDTVLIYLHFIWIMPFQILLIGYVMWESVGFATLVGVGVMIAQTFPIQGYLTRVAAKLRSSIAARTDERVQVMSEMISGIQVVKMYSWEEPFESIVSKVRAMEMKLITYSAYLRGTHLGMMNFSGRVTIYATMVTFALMGNSLTAEVVFPVSSLFHALQMTCALLLPQAVIQASEAAVSLRRVTEFLLLDEVKKLKHLEPTSKDAKRENENRSANDVLENEKEDELEPWMGNKDRVPTEIDRLTNDEMRDMENEISGKFKRGIEIEMVSVMANWISGQQPQTLVEASMKIKSRSLAVIAGSVGSGKSSLLHLLLGELPVESGRLSFFTCKGSEKLRISSRDIRISYSGQDPWLFSASVRDNILFGQPYDEERYQEVTEACALAKDFEQLPHGDLSLVGERGASLSGGQRARVNLARAVYRDADLYLLDDPLSAVDTQVSRHLFNKCIKGFLKDKTRILVTHQLQFLGQVDDVIIIDQGKVRCQGTYDEIAETSLFRELSSHELGVHEVVKEAEEGRENDTDDMAADVTVGFTDALQKVSKGTEEPEDLNEEEIEKGTTSIQVYKSYFLAGGNPCTLILLIVIFIIAQAVTNISDYWLSYWTDHNSIAGALKLNASVNNGNTSSQNIDAKNTTEVSALTESLWFDKSELLSTNVAIQVYTALIVTNVLLIFVRSVFFIRTCMKASRNVHNSMFSNLLRAPMRFFNTNPAGRILNRFSKDMGTMDEILPKAMLETCQILAVTIGIFSIVIVVIPLAVVLVIIITGLVYFVTIFCVKTTQDIKRLEGITKSPVFSQVSSTLDGLTTIRSRGRLVEVMLRKEFDRYQDKHTSACYLTISTLTAFGFAIDLISCLFTTCVCLSFIFIGPRNFLGGSVGLVISQCINLTGLIQFGVRLCVQVISQITSVERILQYTNLPKEGPFTTDKPPPVDWPSKGDLAFNHVSMKYADAEPPVLKDLNMHINPGWKVGIVGRTGAGKSSLISALFRLAEDGLEGEILLDGINTKSIGLRELRPCISIIPQVPVLFSASLRYNLDPFDQYSDVELWDSLREVELGDAVQSLDFQVAEGGANFSVGQRQLICLARAILRNNRLLVLDEATANIDRSTDALIQNTIRRKFTNCTVLTIAHRLNTIMDSDRVLVMEGGCIVEFGPPHLLLKNPNGYFFQMLQQTGKATAEKLAQIAESSYTKLATNTMK